MKAWSPRREQIVRDARLKAARLAVARQSRLHICSSSRNLAKPRRAHFIRRLINSHFNPSDLPLAPAPMTITDALTLALDHHRAGRLPAAEQLYRQILEAQPNHLDANHLLGVLAHQVGRSDLAVDCIGRAIRLNENVADFHNNLANAYLALDRFPEAIASCRRALELKPAYPEALHSLGSALMAAGKPQDAAAAYRGAIDLNPSSAESHHELGLAFVRCGQPELAIPCFRRAIELSPGANGAHHNLGNALKELGRLSAAADSYRRAIELEPAFARAHTNLGFVLTDLGKPEEAVVCYERALALQPGRAEAHGNLGAALANCGRLDEAAACHRRALELEPNDSESHYNLGVALMEQGKLVQALASFARAIELQPEFAKAQLNLGNALKKLGKLDEAAVCFRRTLEIAPNHPMAHNNLGAVFKDQLKLDEAAACYRRALELKPDSGVVHYNLGLLLLQIGRYEEGWRECEHRLDVPPAPRRFASPRWNGEPAEGRTIFIYREQGAGDAIQFMRYAPLVRAHSGARRVIVEAHPELVRLFGQNQGWDAEIVAGSDAEETALPPFDCQIPLMSLPLALGFFDPLPMAGAYLRADPELCQAWRDRLGASSAFRVGLVWAGSPRHQMDRLRSIDPQKLLPLLRLANCEFYSLQIGAAGAPTSPLKEAGLIDLTERIVDFADTAALMAELDLVITVDTAVAHLAGAMGRPVWTLLSHQGEWRWGVTGDTTPWYPSMRLFRQPEAGDWEGVVRDVARNLKAQISNLK